MDNFGKWIADELKKKQWKQADLARASSLDSAVISNLVNNRRGPGEDTCNAIARAFGYPPEVVFRVAGMLPPIPEADEKNEQWMYLYDQLVDKDKLEMIELVKLKIQLSKQKAAWQE